MDDIWYMVMFLPGSCWGWKTSETIQNDGDFQGPTVYLTEGIIHYMMIFPLIH